jgi:nucleoside-diphosphate-sugar epimerase
MIFILGGSGFIGTVLGRRLLKDNILFKNIDKQPSREFAEFTQIGDIRNAEKIAGLLKKESVNDFVVLLAAEHRDDVSPISLYYDVNVEGAKNVTAAMEKQNINKIIFTSSVAVYGLNKENPSEEHPVDPFNHYGKSKWEAEEVLREWYNKAPSERTLIIIRPTVVFGPENRGNVFNLLKQIASGKFMMIGNGNNRKSMAYVENLVGFIKYCMDHDITGNHIYNYVDKPDLSMNELIKVAEQALNKKLPPLRIPYWIGYLGGISFDILAKLTRKKFPVSAIRIKKFCATTQFDNKGIIKSGYKPIFTLQEGLSETLASINTTNK